VTTSGEEGLDEKLGQFNEKLYRADPARF